MNGIQCWRRALATTVAVMFASGLSLALDQNSAHGGITVNGVKSEPGYAYAITRPALASKKPETTLVLTDKQLSPKAVTAKFELMRVRRGNGVQTLEFTFDDSTMLPSAQFSIDPMNGGGYSNSYKVEVEAFW